jgi:hypothetical protein
MTLSLKRVHGTTHSNDVSPENYLLHIEQQQCNCRQVRNIELFLQLVAMRLASLYVAIWSCDFTDHQSDSFDSDEGGGDRAVAWRQSVTARDINFPS